MTPMGTTRMSVRDKLITVSVAAFLFFVAAIFIPIFVPGADRHLEINLVGGLIVFVGFMATSRYLLHRKLFRAWVFILCVLGPGSWAVFTIVGGSFLSWALAGTLCTIGFCAPLAVMTIFEIVRRTVLVEEFVSWRDLRNILLAYVYWLVSSACFLTLPQLTSRDNFQINKPSHLFVDMLYFCTITFTTVGYGDVAPLTSQAKVIVIIFSFVSFLLAGLGIGCIVKGVKVDER